MDNRLWTNKKQLWIALLVICLLTPAGILLPKFFKSGDAWGEWDNKQVREKVGYEPEEMKKDAALWKAPIKDYSIEQEPKSVLSESINYMVSAAVGIGIIVIITWLTLKFYKRNG
jgi:hypothetical protein